MRKGMKALLVVSLMLNLMFIGVAVGGLIGHDRRGAMVRPPEDMSLGPLGSAFSREDRAAMRRDAERAGANLGTMRADMQADMAALTTAVVAEPWDPEAVRQALGAMRHRSDRRVELGEKVMIDRLSAMTAAERAGYAQKLRERFERSFTRGQDGRK